MSPKISFVIYFILARCYFRAISLFLICALPLFMYNLTHSPHIPLRMPQIIHIYICNFVHKFITFKIPKI